MPYVEDLWVPSFTDLAIIIASDPASPNLTIASDPAGSSCCSPGGMLVNPLLIMACVRHKKNSRSYGQLLLTFEGRMATIYWLLFLCV